ncbi:PucR family transcriptional regulator [Leucobacter triazinivorans]|uniref:PucR family transcriptional regulator n=1 Tax=Leucobacter triazinivorans TaxID=1784719 RepID=A0A4P6KGN2_9MICO|nr:helix-turn-helix domain-containing protein [Leucobacter triazinivorans]QBE49148.1 PucR family transcriptional regulator [Leucobacter triazinivorans]
MTPDHARTLSDTPRPDDRDRWLELLDRLDLDQLTETFLALVGSVAGYDPPPIPRSEMRRTGRLSFSALVDGLRAGGFDEEITISTDVGVSRARAGVPITSLMTAIRHDFTVLWEALTRVADADDAELLVRHTGIVLRTVDEYVGQTQRAYVAERERMREEAASVRQGLIASLFQEPQPAGQHLRSIASELGLPPQAPLLVVAATEDDIAPLRVAISELERAGATVHTHHLGDALVAFTRPIDLPGSRLDELGRQLLELRVGVITAAAGIADLRRSAATAGELAHLFAPDETGAMTWSRGWARLAARTLLASGRPILSDVQAALERCGEAERSRLEEAVRSYLRTGSVSESAAELFCHRNTLTNRLRRFADLTGIDPAVPEQAARLVVGWA